MGTLVFILVLSVLIIVHEWGHYISARWFGIKVEKFSIGFGRPLFRKRLGDTEFLVSAVPLGGYVKMAGDERGTCRGQRDEFYAHPVWHRAVVVLMGPAVNIVFAWLCFLFILITGYPSLTPQVGRVMEGMPAQAVGLQAGDVIQMINGQSIRTWDELKQAVSQSKGQPLTLEFIRDGTTRRVVVEPAMKEIENIFGVRQTLPLLGIQPEPKVVLLRYGVGESLIRSVQEIGKTITTTIQALFYVATGVMPAKDALAGPIRIFDLISQAFHLGAAYLIYIMAVISANLAVFNLLPIPVLDGGHLLFFLIEAVRRRPLPQRTEERLSQLGLTVLIGLMIFVIFNDMQQVGWLDHLKKWFTGS